MEARKAKEAKKEVQDIYEGDFELVVPLAGFERVKQFAASLGQIENIKIVWVGGAVDEGAIIGISVRKPMTLIQILNKMPMVQKIDKKAEKILVTLKATS